MITRENGEYVLRSKKTGKVLGRSKSMEGIKNRERQVQYFKHVNASLESCLETAAEGMLKSADISERLKEIFGKSFDFTKKTFKPFPMTQMPVSDTATRQTGAGSMAPTMGGGARTKGQAWGDDRLAEISRTSGGTGLAGLATKAHDKTKWLTMPVAGALGGSVLGGITGLLAAPKGKKLQGMMLGGAAGLAGGGYGGHAYAQPGGSYFGFQGPLALGSALSGPAIALAYGLNERRKAKLKRRRMANRYAPVMLEGL